ncbi:carboxymuconolactone decarboxylase family protein [Salipiger aestuarii]|uniref:carboxymuconolactone decarboxylase family protein n=1 Tax=Salipiger aestuarii TaxID=568098 RepID=UPI00025B5F94|nr:carboxymuconolactone decarboxylase [Salipiger aestuarii]EIE51891.1 carboxymuconolactone decarboxylase [Citreicella sp. 357]
MTADAPHMDACARGNAFPGGTNPGGMKDGLHARDGHLLPGLARDRVEYNGRSYTRGVPDAGQREGCSIAVPTAMGGRSRPQPWIHLAAAPPCGQGREAIAEAICQMALYGGMPAMFNAPNAAMKVCEAEENSA